ncbi:hypothetical protein ACQHIV_03200 [Kribbella sp. GL6]|uniref:hypothetical protein n=1 Tax=Kribbella sp. GL6 TaxID=3419765 RepID=UPI003D000FBA
MTDLGRSRRWPAYVMAALFLEYAVAKAVRAGQGRLGIPGGPPVPAAVTARYPVDPALAQSIACATGLVAAAVALATVTALGRRIPRLLMLGALAVLVVAVGAGAATMSLDAFVGLGIGWRWYQGVGGLLSLALSLEMVRSYLVATRRAR